MKTSTLLKTLSAIGILGTAVFSMNANAEGGCPAGSVPQRGQGWQTCVPMNNGGGATPSLSSPRQEDNVDYRGMVSAYMGMPVTLMVITFDKKTDKIYQKALHNVPKTNINFTNSDRKSLQSCKNSGGDCRWFVAEATQCIAIMKSTQPVAGKWDYKQIELPQMGFSKYRSLFKEQEKQGYKLVEQVCPADIKNITP